MSLIGEVVTVVESSDPSKKGRRGAVVLETANTLRLQDGPKRLTIEKKGTVLAVEGSEKLASEVDFAGRLEDRLRSRP